MSIKQAILQDRIACFCQVQ